MSRRSAVAVCAAATAALGIAALIIVLAGGSGEGSRTPVLVPPDRHFDVHALPLRGNLPELARAAPPTAAPTSALLPETEAPPPAEQTVDVPETGAGGETGTGDSSADNASSPPDPGGGVVGVGGG